jgi:hypothetical protein
VNSSGDSFRESWFQQRAAHPAGDDALDDDDRDVSIHVKSEGAVGWALALSALGGGVGGALMLLAARAVAARLHLDVDIIGTVGRGAARLSGLAPFEAGIATGVATGVIVGMLFGALTRHSLRLVARVLAGLLLGPVVWTLVQAFVFKSFAPASLGALPFGPMAVGAALFGLCATIVPPPRRLDFARAVAADDDDL